MRPAYAAGRAPESAPRPAVYPTARNAFRLAVVAVALQFILSSNLLYVMGISYDVPGGNPLIKFHPSTYLAVLAALLAMRSRAGGRGSLARAFQDAPAYVAFVSAMLLCSVFALVSIGTRGAAVFVENYVSAGLLAYALETSGEQARRSLGRMMLAFSVVNVIVAVGETLTHTHVIPPFLGAEKFVEAEGDFRGTAGFDHPLTGAAVVMMSLLCLPELGLPSLVSALCFPILCIGLLAFGGRTALGVSIVAMVSVTAYQMVRGMVVRRLDAKLFAAAVVATLLIPPAAYVTLNYTPVGERLVSHFYVDDSAEVRSVQWQVLDHLSLRDALFGVPEDEIPFLIFTVNLDQKLDAIESPWLLTFLKIGALGCVIFLAGVIPFLVRLWRLSSLWGKTLLISGIIVISSSNSLGVKSNVLFLLTAFVVTAGGYGLKRNPAIAHAAATPAPAARADSPNRRLFKLPDERGTFSRSVAS